MTVFGTGLALFAGMVLYSWTARERWRSEYYAEHTSYSALILLEVPGFRMKGMDFIEYSAVSPIDATIAYVLEGQGDHRGVSLYVESNPGQGFSLDTGEELAARDDGLDLEDCRLSRLVKPGGQQMCMDFGGVVFLLDGATFSYCLERSGIERGGLARYCRQGHGPPNTGTRSTSHPGGH